MNLKIISDIWLIGLKYNYAILHRWSTRLVVLTRKILPRVPTPIYIYIYQYLGNKRFRWISLDILIKRPPRRPIDCRTLSNIFLPGWPLAAGGCFDIMGNVRSWFRNYVTLRVKIETEPSSTPPPSLSFLSYPPAPLPPRMCRRRPLLSTMQINPIASVIFIN